MNIRLKPLSLGALLVAAACAGEKPPPKPALTEHQRDSAIGESKIPGAQGVKKALQVQDSSRTRAARIDSMP